MAARRDRESHLARPLHARKIADARLRILGQAFVRLHEILEIEVK